MEWQIDHILQIGPFLASTTIELRFVLPSFVMIWKIWKLQNQFTLFGGFIVLLKKLQNLEIANSVNTVWWIYTFIKILPLRIYGWSIHTGEAEEVSEASWLPCTEARILAWNSCISKKVKKSHLKTIGTCFRGFKGHFYLFYCNIPTKHTKSGPKTFFTFCMTNRRQIIFFDIFCIKWGKTRWPGLQI